MKNDATESILRRAAPTPAPMDDARADRVWQNALAQTRQKHTNRRRGIFAVASFGAATVAGMLCLAAWNHAPLPALTPATVVLNHKEIKDTKKGSAEIIAAPRPVLARVAPVEAVAVAKEKRQPMRRKRVRRRTVSPLVRSLRLCGLKEKTVAVVAPPVDETPFLFVTATGTPPDESLAVTVRMNVPDDVPGRAEAAAVRMVAVTDAATPDGELVAVPVWANVAVETGREPVMTVAALQ